MDKIELTKENVQPLPCGRKIESLRAALSMDLNETKRRDETKAEFEAKLEATTDDDEKLDVYAAYIRWIEQNYPQGEKTLQSTLEKCILHYYRKNKDNPKYRDSEKLLSIFLKCTNVRENPLQMFQLFCKEGFFRGAAQFYISFAYWYEANGNTNKAVAALQKGIQQKAQPLVELTTALADLQVRTVRQMVANPEAMEEQHQQQQSKSNRKALTGLKAKVDKYGVAEAPVKRVGSALASNTGGLKVAANPTERKTNEQLRILSDENLITEAAAAQPPIPRTPLATSSISAAPAAEPPLPVIKDNKENERDPGKWNENKLKIKGLRKRVPPPSTTPAFEILEDNAGGEQSKVEATSCQQKPPSTTAADQQTYPVAKFDDDAQMSKYVWHSLRSQIYPPGSNTEFSFEELWYPKWLERQQQKQFQLQLQIQQQQLQQQQTTMIQDEHSSKSMCDSSTDAMVTRGATSIVRDFYNGTLNNSSINESGGGFTTAALPNVTETMDTMNFGGAEVSAPKFDDPAPQKSFAIFSETMANAAAAALAADEARMAQSHLNFVTGITAKLSPIIETSREYNKSSSTSSASSSSGSSTGSKSGCYSAYGFGVTGFGLKQQLFSESTFHHHHHHQHQQSNNNHRNELLATLADPETFYVRFKQNNDFLSHVEAILDEPIIIRDDHHHHHL